MNIFWPQKTEQTRPLGAISNERYNSLINEDVLKELDEFINKFKTHVISKGSELSELPNWFARYGARWFAAKIANECEHEPLCNNGTTPPDFKDGYLYKCKRKFRRGSAMFLRDRVYLCPRDGVIMDDDGNELDSGNHCENLRNYFDEGKNSSGSMFPTLNAAAEW